MTRVFEFSADLEGAYRFFENPEVSVEELERTRGEACAKRLDPKTPTIVPIDQTSIKLDEQRKTMNFGSVGNRKTDARGVHVMTAVTLDAEGVVQGVLFQRRWLRSEEPSPRYIHGQNDRRSDKRPAELRESFEWIRVLEGCDEQLKLHAPEARAWYQVDQGADFWRVFTWAHEHEALLTARISNERVVVNHGHINHLHPWIAGRPVAYHYDLELPERVGKDARAYRVAHLSVRFGTTEFQFAVTKKRRTPVTLSVVAVTEPRPPQGVEPIDWLLLTTYPVRTPDDARLVIRNYVLRWRVEEFHRTLKTGACDIEASEMESFESFSRLLVIASSVAARIERIKFLSRTQPDAPATVAYSKEEIDVIIRLREQHMARNKPPFRPSDVPPLGAVTYWVAELGGYRPSKTRGPPGTIVLARGLAILEIAVLGARAARSPPSRCG